MQAGMRLFDNLPTLMPQFFRIVSWIFQPVLMPVYALLIILSLPFYAFTLLPPPLKYFLILSTLLFTLVLPVIFIVLMKRFGIIGSVYMESAAERRYPLLFTLFFHGTNFYFLQKINLPALYYMVLLAGIVSLTVAMIVTENRKLSLHMVGWGNLMGALVVCGVVWNVDVRHWLALSAVLGGLTGTARLGLDAHKLADIAWGFLVGLIPQLAILGIQYF